MIASRGGVATAAVLPRRNHRDYADVWLPAVGRGSQPRAISLTHSMTRATSSSVV